MSSGIGHENWIPDSVGAGIGEARGGNRILQLVPQDEFRVLKAKSEQVPLVARQVLHHWRLLFSLFLQVPRLSAPLVILTVSGFHSVNALSGLADQCLHDVQWQ